MKFEVGKTYVGITDEQIKVLSDQSGVPGRPYVVEINDDDGYYVGFRFMDEQGHIFGQFGKKTDRRVNMSLAELVRVTNYVVVSRAEDGPYNATAFSELDEAKRFAELFKSLALEILEVTTDTFNNVNYRRLTIDGEPKTAQFDDFMD